LDDPVKVIRLRLVNRTGERRSLSVTYYAEWVLGVHREGNASQIVTEWDAAASVLLARNTYQEDFRDATAFLTVHPLLAVGEASSEERGREAREASSRGVSWTGHRLEFLGRNGTLEDPAAMRRL